MRNPNYKDVVPHTSRPFHKLPKIFSEVAKINLKSCQKVANLSEKLPKSCSQFDKKVLQIAQKLHNFLNYGLCVMFWKVCSSVSIFRMWCMWLLTADCYQFSETLIYSTLPGFRTMKITDQYTSLQISVLYITNILVNVDKFVLKY